MRKQTQLQNRKRRRRLLLKRKSQRPRLSVFRSNKHIYAQIINDKKGKTLAAAWDGEVVKRKTQKANVKTKSKKTELSKIKTALSKIEIAGLVGEKLAEEAKKIKIKKVVFDKGAYKYHGQVKALAEGARKGGLSF